MGLNSTLFPQVQSKSLEEKGGSKVDSDGSTPGNQMMIFDHSLKGYRPQGLPSSECEFNFLVPSNSPANQAVVIQQLSIG